MSLELALPKLLNETSTVIADTNDLNAVRNVLILLMERAIRDSESQEKKIRDADRAVQEAREEYRKSSQALNDFGAKNLWTKNQLVGLVGDICRRWNQRDIPTNSKWLDDFELLMRDAERILKETSDKDHT